LLSPYRGTNLGKGIYGVFWTIVFTGNSNRLRSVWQGIEQINFHGFELEENVEEFKSSTIDSLISVDKGLIVRDNYKQVTELTLAVLGNPPEKIHWRTPSAIYQAQRITKLLYAFKIFLFGEQQDVFHTTKKEQMQLRRFVQFVALLYSKAWIEAPLTAKTPGNDLIMERLKIILSNCFQNCNSDTKSFQKSLVVPF
ncbi:hypothetical protein AVEN_167031-1, partial [Araneus ventricosus]